MKTITLPRSTGPSLRNLPSATKAGLVAWLALTAAMPAVLDECGDTRYAFSADDVPMGYTRALRQLSPAYGIQIRFAANELRSKHCRPVPDGKTIPGCVGGGKRKVRRPETAAQPTVRVRGRNGVGFVPGGGEKVAAYNNAFWRDDAL